MRVKLFWTSNPIGPGRIGSRGQQHVRGLEEEINAWLADRPGLRVVDIKQSASGGSFAGSIWLVSVWYEEAEG